MNDINNLIMEMYFETATTIEVSYAASIVVYLRHKFDNGFVPLESPHSLSSQLLVGLQKVPQTL